MLVSGDRIIKGVERFLRDRSRPGRRNEGSLAVEGGEP
jgi:hypothetical protein